MEQRVREDGRLQSFNPRTGEVVRTIDATPVAEVAEVVTRARKVAPEWAAIPPQGRARILREVRFRIGKKIDDIVDAVSTECGKPKAEALGHDTTPLPIMLAYLEHVAPRALRPERPGRFVGPLTGTGGRVEWRPFGVVGAITPWNYPMLNSFAAFAPALFAGNTVVIKPSEVTPQCGEVLRDLLEPLPPGVATVVQGGRDVGAALVDAPCDKISFIGSPATGRKICEAAAKHLTPVVMELGGKDAAIVCSDADLDKTTSGLVWASFFNAGQTCASVERVYVVDAVADEFRSKFLEKLSQVRHRTDVGPLTFKPQLEIVQRHVSDAIDKGATLLSGGRAGANEDGSLWFEPTVLENVTTDMDVVRHETFGPVVTITRVRDEDEAVRRANEEAVNLTASIWSRSNRRTDALADGLRAGTITQNFHGESLAYPWSPWGGTGESGFGRLSGRYGIREFVQPVNLQRSTTPWLPRLWWYPYTDNTVRSVRSIAELMSSPTWGGKAKALGRLTVAAVKTLREKL
ncbi:MAG TPA: aldehyde dehydrogenase family protein [Actinomycetota bacterium]|nr:aldehyde dehydrogenase family protein [Actinomycetota bacterium]